MKALVIMRRPPNGSLVSGFHVTSKISLHLIISYDNHTIRFRSFDVHRITPNPLLILLRFEHPRSQEADYSSLTSWVAFEDDGFAIRDLENDIASEGSALVPNVTEYVTGSLFGVLPRVPRMAPPIPTIPLLSDELVAIKMPWVGVGSLDCLLCSGRWLRAIGPPTVLPQLRLSLVNAVTNVSSKNLARVVKALHSNMIWRARNSEKL